MLTFDPNHSSLISDREKITYKFCDNKQHGVCNWLIEASSTEVFFAACQLNRTIPDLSDERNFPKWQNLNGKI
jgi:hypothetical protein